MSEISNNELKKLQNISVNMAKYFVEFCKHHNLTCYLCGGGCIGAVRHKGMIPWDDDLDFFMPRNDYEKLAKIWNQKESNRSKYILEKSNASLVNHSLFLTIRDKETTFIKPYQKDLDLIHGVALDVLPLDGYPNNKFQRKVQCFWALVYSLYCSQLVPQNHGKVVNLLGRIALSVISNKRMRYKIWKYAEKQMSKYSIEECNGITELCSGPGYMKNFYPKKCFASAIYVPFETGMMPIPVGYDEYLRIAFGDYMTMPPEDERVGHHDAWYMDLDTPYMK